MTHASVSPVQFETEEMDTNSLSTMFGPFLSKLCDKECGLPDSGFGGGVPRVLGRRSARHAGLAWKAYPCSSGDAHQNF